MDLPAYANSHVLNPSDTFATGTKNSQVKSLETGLKALGYDVGKVDTQFDDETAIAMQEFQTDHHLDVTGTMQGKTTEKFTELLRLKLENDPQLKGAENLVKTMK